MGTHPYIALMVDDYEAATAHLTLAEDGAYNRLLRLAWRTPGCSLPNDPAWIARKMRATPEEYEAVVKPVLAEFFKLRRGRLVQLRLKRDYDEVACSKVSRAEAGKMGGIQKALNSKENVSSNGNRLLSPPRASPSPPPSPQERTPLPPVGGGAEVVDLFGAERLPETPKPKPDLDQAFEDWNALARRCGLSVAVGLTDARRKSLGVRLKAYGLSGWRRALAAVEGSAFCRGMVPPREGRRPFRADLDFVLQAKSFTRLLEGYYGEDAEVSGDEDKYRVDPQELWDARVLEFYATKAWKPDWGPAPNDPGCTVDPVILIRHGFRPREKA